MSRAPIDLADVKTTATIDAAQWGHMITLIETLRSNISTATPRDQMEQIRLLDRRTRPWRDEITRSLQSGLRQERRRADEAYWQSMGRYPSRSA